MFFPWRQSQFMIFNTRLKQFYAALCCAVYAVWLLLCDSSHKEFRNKLFCGFWFGYTTLSICSSYYLHHAIRFTIFQSIHFLCLHYLLLILLKRFFFFFFCSPHIYAILHWEGAMEKSGVLTMIMFCLSISSLEFQTQAISSIACAYECFFYSESDRLHPVSDMCFCVYMFLVHLLRKFVD